MRWNLLVPRAVVGQVQLPFQLLGREPTLEMRCRSACTLSIRPGMEDPIGHIGVLVGQSTQVLVECVRCVIASDGSVSDGPPRVDLGPQDGVQRGLADARREEDQRCLAVVQGVEVEIASGVSNVDACPFLYRVQRVADPGRQRC